MKGEHGSAEISMWNLLENLVTMGVAHRGAGAVNRFGVELSRWPFLLEELRAFRRGERSCWDDLIVSLKHANKFRNYIAELRMLCAWVQDIAKKSLAPNWNGMSSPFMVFKHCRMFAWSESGCTVVFPSWSIFQHEVIEYIYTVVQTTPQLII